VKLKPPEVVGNIESSALYRHLISGAGSGGPDEGPPRGISVRLRPSSRFAESSNFLAVSMLAI